MTLSKRRPLHERFWSKVNTGDGPDDCWLWEGAKAPFGHGHITDGGKTLYTHRLAWELTNGPIPAGLFVCHRCDRPSCCNPAHLYLGTPKDNVQDRFDRGRDWQSLRTHCTHGHPLDGDNLYVSPQGARACQTCRRERWAKQNAKRKAERAARKNLPMISYVSFIVFMMASLILAPGSAGHAGTRAEAVHNSRSAR